MEETKLEKPQIENYRTKRKRKRRKTKGSREKYSNKTKGKRRNEVRKRGMKKKERQGRWKRWVVGDGGDEERGHTGVEGSKGRQEEVWDAWEDSE